MKITATNQATGEVIELDANNLDQIVEAWRIAQEYDNAATALKDQLKKLVPEMVNNQGVSEPVGDYMFRVSNVQRQNYDKSVMREVLDADTFDLLLKPDKPAIDTYIKENLDNLGEASTVLRGAMVSEGQPYQVIRLEKIRRAK